MTILRLARPLVPVLLGLAAAGALAQDLRVGLIHISPSVSSPGLKPLNSLGSLLAVPGVSATLSSANTVLVTYEQRFLADRFGVEVVLGIPPKHDIIGAGLLGVLLPGQPIGSLRQLSPAMLFNYHFGDRHATWRPSIGIGPVYATVSDIKIDLLPNTTATATKAWGWAAGASMSYAVDAHWHVVGSLGYSGVKNSITLSTDTSKPPYSLLAFAGLPAGIAQTKLDVATKNTTLSLAIGYGF